MNTKGLLGYILAVIIALLWACGLQCNEQKQPETERIEQSRKQDIKKSDSLGVIEKEVIRDRWRTKTKYDTIIKEVLMYDSSETNAAFDSLVGTKKNAVVIFYKWQSDSLQLSLMDSAHVLDSLRIGLLTEANKKCDTLLTEAEKRAKKRFWSGFRWGYGSGYITAEVKNVLIK